MAQFNNINELINTLYRSKELLKEIFEKRRSFQYRYEHAIELVDEDQIGVLINRGIIRQNGIYIELDDQYQEFFEQVLEVNEEINTSYINENILLIKQNINYYLQESNSGRQLKYIKQIKSSFRKAGRITLRNVIDLNRNIENAFKTEPNYSIKITKLESFDDKRKLIFELVQQMERLISGEEKTFFLAATDDELKNIVHQLGLQLTEARHNLIETEKQIIQYLNQVKYHSGLFVKIRQLKYLKDQFELNDKTNLRELLHDTNDLIFETQPVRPIRLSLDYLQTDEAYESILKIAARMKAPKTNQVPSADSISREYLQTDTEEEIFINLQEVKNSFVSSGNHLFSFLDTYRFPRPVSYEEKITVFCQLVGIYEKEFDVTDSYQSDGEVEYALVYPLQQSQQQRTS